MTEQLGLPLTLDPDEARTRAVDLARALLAAQDLTGWGVVINGRMTSRFGLCKYHRKEIHLARWLIEEAPWSEVEDTIRHEVAHAVVGHEHGHDGVWMDAARQLGARPQRCASGRVWKDHAPAARRPAKWLVTCEACGLRFLRRRRDRGRMMHGQCGTVVSWDINPDWAEGLA